ncbi:MAG TPA: 1-acyl-sn-glycerol-3-phosphate acyltransferase [Acidobacteriota bacterium]|nr:1-acyl-sn-glycerol-3-phosphate acyltransferase [Acidobacteriota bacterium]
MTKPASSEPILIIGERRSVAQGLAAGLRRQGQSAVLRRAPEAQAELARLRPASLIVAPELSSSLDWSPQPQEAVGLAEGAAQLGLRRLILLSSTLIYPPSHHHPGYVDESYKTARPAPGPARRWADYEERLRAAADSPKAPALCVLRTAPLLGPAGQGPFRHLVDSGLPITPLGYDPTLQILHEDDLVQAVLAALETSPEGVFNVVPSQAIPVRQALQLAGSRRLPLPVSLQRPLRRLLSPLGAAAHPGWIEYLRHSFTASGLQASRQLGFEARYTSAQAVLARTGGKPRHGSSDGPVSPPRYDRFGLDRDYVRSRVLLRFMHDIYWRIEESGWENVPRQGRAVLVGIHRGFMPWDGVMLMHGAVQNSGRFPRFLIHPSLVKFPGLATFMTKMGGVPSNHENADWVLQNDHILGVYPEGIHGAFTPYREAYSLGRFGRSDFVRIALRNRAPILPVVTAGSAEIFPILGRLDWKWFRRFTEWPYLPITPTFPLAPLPLPSKWHTRFLPPFHIEDEHPPQAADDPALVRRISIRVRDAMQEAVEELLRQRKSIWR